MHSLQPLPTSIASEPAPALEAMSRLAMELVAVFAGDSQTLDRVQNGVIG